MTRTGLCAVALLAAAVSTAAAQTTAPPAPAQAPAVRPAPTLQTTAITLADAVQSTIERSPAIAFETATVDALTGRQQQAAGPFDSLLRVGPSAGFMMQQLNPGLLLATRGTRDALASIASSFTQLTGLLQVAIRNDRIAPPRCPSNLVELFGGFTDTSGFATKPVKVDRVDPRELNLLGSKKPLAGTPIGDILGSITLANVCTDPRLVGLTPQNFFQALRDIVNSHAIDQSGGQGIIGFEKSAAQVEPEGRLLQLQIASGVASRARLALERLGPVPFDELNRTTAFDASLLKPFRNGVSVTGALSIQSQDRNFRDKPYDPGFGGLGQPPAFNSSLTFTLNAPLGRGFGTQAVTAPERSATVLVGAARESLRQNAAEQALRTTLAYLNVVAAQETLATFEASAGRQRRLIELTNQGVQAGELPGAEVDRARARAARVDSSVSAARAALIAARVSLAEAMGVEADRLSGMPTATETFARGLATVAPTNEILTRALSLRRDVRAREQRMRASEILATGARANLRRRYDFLLTGGLSNLYDSPVYRFLPDEQSPIIPAPAQSLERAIHYYSPRGYYRSLTLRYEPFVTAQFSVQLPFANSAARGRLRQAEATVSTSRIDAQDLRRTIRENVVDVAEQLRRSAAAVDLWESAVRADEQTMQGALQSFEIRETTLIDALLTEEETTEDKLQLIGQRQIYFSTLARLTFETGELVTFDGPGIRNYKFDPAILVGR